MKAFTYFATNRKGDKHILLRKKLWQRFLMRVTQTGTILRRRCPSDSEHLGNLLIEAQEDMVDSLQVYPAQDICIQ